MSKQSILIADDDCDFREAMAVRCRSLGLTVKTVAHAMDALEQIQQYRPDAAILDLDMPPGNGLAVCEMLAHSADLKSVPIILITGQKSANIVPRCHELGAYYVPKSGDVWSRIHPLLTDLLELPHSFVSPESSPPENADVQSTADICGPSIKSATLVSMPSLVDAVFQALGCDEGARPDEGAVTSSRSACPWVLCIDDDADLSMGLQRRLEEKGVETLRASAGREGYRCAFLGQAQAIILDYELPEGNGDYVLRRLRENPVTKDIPVIVLTGRRDAQLERQMYSLGASCFLNKPYDWDELWRELQRHLTFESHEAWSLLTPA